MIRYIVIMLALLCNGCSMYYSAGPAMISLDIQYVPIATLKGELSAEWNAWPLDRD